MAQIRGLLMATCMSWAAGIALSPFRCAVRSADLLPLSELASLANHLLAPTSLMSFAVRSLSVWHTSTIRSFAASVDLRVPWPEVRSVERTASDRWGIPVPVSP